MHAHSRFAFLLLALAFIVSSCARQSAHEFMVKADDLAKKKKFDEAATVYRQITEQYPDADEAPAACYWLGNIQLNQQKNPNGAIQTFNLLVAKYPKSTWAHKALFAVGFTYANQLQDAAHAREAYEKYLAQYPDSAFAKDVKFELANLGKSPEELLNALKDTTTKVAAK